MSETLIILASVYFSVISSVAVTLTIVDKISAGKGGWRIPEKSLIICALLGGALLEYIAMKIIRHKTMHKKFMIGLPVIILVQIALIVIFICLK